MEIIHHICVREPEPIKKKLDLLGVSMKHHEYGTVSQPLNILDIPESDPLWPAVARIIRERGRGHITWAVFTEEELARARHLRLRGDWFVGYPEPSDTHAGWICATYDDSVYCRECGMGLRQKAPFRFKREPPPTRKQVLQLFWVNDEFFVRPDTWEAVFKPFGIEHRPVVKCSGKPLETFVQLCIPEPDGAELDMRGYPRERCPKCLRVRYEPRAGWFAPLLKEVDLPLFKAKQYLGSGHESYKAVIVSHDLFVALRQHKVKGVKFEAMAPCPWPESGG